MNNEAEILKATAAYQDKMRSLLGEKITLDINVSNAQTNAPMPVYYLTEERAYRVTIFDKSYLPF